MNYADTAYTTLKAIKAANACEDGYRKLCKALGKTKADDEPVSLLTILDSNGLDDALWVLSYAMPGAERLARHFQAWCAEQVLNLFESDRPGDMRVRDQIEMLRRDDATSEERAAARAAAWDAAWGAARVSAWAAARDAVRDAARDAAWADERGEDDARAAQERQLRKMLDVRTIAPTAAHAALTALNDAAHEARRAIGQDHPLRARLMSVLRETDALVDAAAPVREVGK